MKNTYKLITILIALLIITTACGDDSDSETDEAASDNGSSSDSTEQNDVEEGTVVLQLGESGTIDTILGKYEITIHSAESYESIDGNNSSRGVFTVLSTTITNVGENTLNGDDIARAVLSRDTVGGTPNDRDLDFVENFTDPIEPGESVTGELIFDHSVAENLYEVKFGTGVSTTPDELVWEYTGDDID
ncbi:MULTISPECIES: DUF4352 domain-containing protein [Bacillaceae]|uniref:DUF4352 domain-containing protein n=1 Tax=Evansella alkalicola TaxID=745819 RepID=A0ABS6K0S2_9BACI|nr:MULTISPECIES: DUF4352 domain-containing protein [Bacillaceae]MBU9724255.1 DUF4352 domain-containing protein [Bacillus alkalicola]